MDKKEEKS